MVDRPREPLVHLGCGNWVRPSDVRRILTFPSVPAAPATSWRAKPTPGVAAEVQVVLWDGRVLRWNYASDEGAEEDARLMAELVNGHGEPPDKTPEEHPEHQPPENVVAFSGKKTA